MLPGSPGQGATVCCVGAVRRCAGEAGDTSPEQTRLRPGPGETGDYWAAESLSWPQSPRSVSEEKSVMSSHRPCDDIGPGPRHSSVPSSPAQSSGSRLWGSFRGKKPPTIDKRSLNPYLKTAS